jgi:hypothetical protein
MTLDATICGLGPAAHYQVRLRFADARGEVAYSNVLLAITWGLGWPRSGG